MFGKAPVTWPSLWPSIWPLEELQLRPPHLSISPGYAGAGQSGHIIAKRYYTAPSEPPRRSGLHRQSASHPPTPSLLPALRAFEPRGVTANLLHTACHDRSPSVSHNGTNRVYGQSLVLIRLASFGLSHLSSLDLTLPKHVSSPASLSSEPPKMHRLHEAVATLREANHVHWTIKVCLWTL